MGDKTISADELIHEWRQDPAFVAAYDALAEEFVLADVKIRERKAADTASVLDG